MAVGDNHGCCAIFRNLDKLRIINHQNYSRIFFFFCISNYHAKMYYLHYTLTGCGILDWDLTCSVTVLLLLGLWLSAVWAVGCCNELGVYGNNYSKGRAIITIYTDSQPLSPCLYS